MTVRFHRFKTLLALVLASASTACAFADGVDPAEAQKRLNEGNQRFVQGQAAHPNCDEVRRRDTAEHGQHPFATILTCSDSRVSPEWIFDQGIGDVFIVRVAGNVADTDEIGSIEYGVGHLHTPLLVVMGHSACGAVGAVVSGAQLEGCLPLLVDNIVPAVQQTRRANPGVGTEGLIAKAVDANVFQSIADVFITSAEVRSLVQEGKLTIVGAVYDLGTGGVRWLGEHPEQGVLSKGGKPGGWQPRTVVLGAQAEKVSTVKSTHSQTSANGLPEPSAAFQMLRDGNSRFATGNCTHPHSDRARIAETAKGQHPFATVLTCSDSRVPAERVFDQGIGDVFTVRVAGNVADTDEIGSIEYSVGHLETPILVVLGHTACGAVTAVATNAEVHGSIPPLVANIRPAVKKTLAANPGLSGNPLVAAAIRSNVRQSIDDLLSRSPTVRKRFESGQLMMVGGVYDLASGTVDWFSTKGEPWSDGGFLNSPSATSDSKPPPAVDAVPETKSPPATVEHGGSTTPKSDSPAHAGPTTETPAARPNPTPGEPGHDTPAKPAHDKPADPGNGDPTDKPSNEKPTTDTPHTDPGHDAPKTDKPNTDKPEHETPSKDKPGHDEPTKDKPEHP